MSTLKANKMSGSFWNLFKPYTKNKFFIIYVLIFWVDIVCKKILETRNKRIIGPASGSTTGLRQIEASNHLVLSDRQFQYESDGEIKTHADTI